MGHQFSHVSIMYTYLGRSDCRWWWRSPMCIRSTISTGCEYKTVNTISKHIELSNENLQIFVVRKSKYL